jgi:hypothetical protein
MPDQIPTNWQLNAGNFNAFNKIWVSKSPRGWLGKSAWEQGYVYAWQLFCDETLQNRALCENSYWPAPFFFSWQPATQKDQATKARIPRWQPAVAIQAREAVPEAILIT